MLFCGDFYFILSLFCKVIFIFSYIFILRIDVVLLILQVYCMLQLHGKWTILNLLVVFYLFIFYLYNMRELGVFFAFVKKSKTTSYVHFVQTCCCKTFLLLRYFQIMVWYVLYVVIITYFTAKFAVLFFP